MPPVCPYVDVLEVHVIASGIVPLLDLVAYVLNRMVVPARTAAVGVGAGAEDLHPNLLGHFSLHLLPGAQATLFFDLNHETTGRLAFFLMKPVRISPAAFLSRFLLAVGIKLEVPAVWEFARLRCTPAWVVEAGVIGVVTAI